MSKNSWLNRNSNFRSILKSKTVLYLVFVCALLNLYMFVSNHDWMFAAIFILVGYLTCFFSQNMIVILCIATATANILKYGTKIRVRDGFTSESVSNEIVTDEPIDSVPYLEEQNLDTETNEINPSVENAKANIQKAIHKSDKSTLDQETKDNIKGLLDTQLKLLLGVSELQPLLKSSKEMMRNIQENMENHKS